MADLNRDKITEQRQVFDRIVRILEHARTNVVRTVNSQMVTAYWLIGREIVEEIQTGKNRAVKRTEIRDFYETEAIAGRWSTRELERQISSLLYDRLLKCPNPRDVRRELIHEPHLLMEEATTWNLATEHEVET